MSATLFLPWLRRGIGEAIGAPDDLTGPLALRPQVTASIAIEDDVGGAQSATSPLALLGPGDVTGLAAGQVVRCEPTPGTTDFEPNYLPYVDLSAPELPWLLTPASAGTGNALRPWLVLVVVEVREGVELTHPVTASCPVLLIDAALIADELPPLEDSYAWAHVASAVGADAVPAEVEAATGAVVCRLVCPRRLQPGRPYRAAVVPAFAIGVDAALGRPLDAHRDLQPAWEESGNDAVELPAYHTWTFSTSAEAGDFEALCKRLEPDTEGGRIGFHAARVEAGDLLAPFAGSGAFDIEGALVDPGAHADELGTKAQAWFEDGMTSRLNASADRAVPTAGGERYVPERDDPVVGPPLYGSWAAQRFGVPDEGWRRTVNLRPASRAAAGLGAAVVRAAQEELLAAAWDQAGQLREVNDALNRGRLAVEIGRSQLRRFGALDDAALLAMSARVHPFVADGQQTVARSMRDSAVVPSGLTTPAFLRLTRRSRPVARFSTAGRATALPSRVLQAFVNASAPVGERPESVESCAAFGRDFLPAGAHTSGSITVAGRRAVPRAARVITTPTDDVRGLSGVLRDQLDPLASVRAGLIGRIDGLADGALGDGLPTRLVVGPEFPDPLFPRLLALGAELAVPGIDAFGANRVRLLAVNEAFLAAFLVGANHEWAREALWAEFPASLGATAFAVFWESLVTGTRDLDADIHDWTNGSELADHVGGTGTSTVVLVRGDLVRRYPSVAFSLLRPLDGAPPILDDDTISPAHVTAPSFRSLLDATTVAVGFPLDPQRVLDEGWYVCLEEPFNEPRAGLDEPEEGTLFGRAPTTSWENLTWANVAREAAYAGLDHIRLADTPWLDGVELEGVTWGRNSAHMAAITFQRPFRFIIPADQLIGGLP